MRPALNNPFHNRFNVPVRSRNDDMQAAAYVAWLRERNQVRQYPDSNSTEGQSPVFAAKPSLSISDAPAPTHWGRIVAAMLAMFLYWTAAVLLKAL